MKTIGSVTIDRPVEEVFEQTLRDVSLWSTIVVEDYVVEDVDDGDIGTRFHTVTEDRGHRMEFEGLVTDHQPPDLHRIELEGPAFGMEVEYRFEAVGSGQTRVTQTSWVEGKGATRIMLKLFGWMMRRSSCDAVQRELGNLKDFCENA